MNLTDRDKRIIVGEDGREWEVWTGDYFSENEWQSYHAPKDRIWN